MGVDTLKSLVLDMDGVLWKGEEAIGDLPAIFSEIEGLRMKFILATNNSTRTPEQIIEKLHRFGVAIDKKHVITSSMVVAEYLHQIHPNGGPVYIIGEDGLIDSLGEKGFYCQDEEVLAVVVGMDRSINYRKLTQATLLIRSGVKFIATNSDKTFPTPRGLAPGAGSILSALTASTDISPIIVGKPNPEIFSEALKALRTNPSETLVIGDRLETDIAGGQISGCKTALVLSGVTTWEMGYHWQPKPDYITNNLTVLIEEIKNEALSL